MKERVRDFVCGMLVMMFLMVAVGSVVALDWIGGNVQETRYVETISLEAGETIDFDGGDGFASMTYTVQTGEVLNAYVSITMTKESTE